ncbi:hypothetical protein ACFL59_02525 [Planctomycetota bacterium]
MADDKNKLDEASFSELARRAEVVLDQCRADMHSLMPSAMVFPSHLGRLRMLAEDMAKELSLTVEAVEEQLKPYEDKLAEICGV